MPTHHLFIHLLLSLRFVWASDPLLLWLCVGDPVSGHVGAQLACSKADLAVLVSSPGVVILPHVVPELWRLVVALIVIAAGTAAALHVASL